MELTFTFEQLCELCKYRKIQFSDGGVFPFCNKTKVQEYCEEHNCPYILNEMERLYDV